jgi:DNA-binding transcriptional ArsR family regulator
VIFVKTLSDNGRRSGRGHAPLDGAQLQAVAELFDVLSEPSRLRILQVLQAGPASVGELVQMCGFKQANVSKQLGMLLSAGVISREQQGNRAIYSIQMPLVFDLCDLVCRGVAQHAAERAAALAKPLTQRTMRR